MASLQGWTETILLSLLFVGVLSAVVIDMNIIYGENYAIPISDDSGSESLFIEYQDTAQTQIEGGEVLLDAEQGITLKSSWGIVKDLVNVIWYFITGGWIANVIGYLNLGVAGILLSTTLRVLFFLSVIFAIIYILFKVKP